MSDKSAVIAVYDPPRPDLPHIAVVIYPDGEVTGIAAYSAAISSVNWPSRSGQILPTTIMREGPRGDFRLRQHIRIKEQ